MARKLTAGIDAQLKEAIERGLERGDANMVRVVNDMIIQEEGMEILRDLQVNIVPYEIADVSLRNIVLKAPDYVVREIEDALIERKKKDMANGTS